MVANYPKAPALALSAEGSGRELHFARPGTTTLLICTTQETQKAAEAIEDAARTRWPLASDLLIAYVIDLRSVPGLFRKIAENVLASEYRRAVETLPAGQPPEDYVVLLPDWRGDAIQALGFEGSSYAPGIAVLTADGRIAATRVAASADEIETLIEGALKT